MLNVAVIPGWAGGKWHTRQFEKTLIEHGYKITARIDADVIIAHSVGCYDLPAKTPARYYILIDPPYWPGKSILRRFAEKQRQDNRHLRDTLGRRYLARKFIWGAWYVITRPRYIYLAVASKSDLNFLNGLKDKNVLVVRNQSDQMCAPEIKVALAAYPWVYFTEVPGEHDDYYTNPTAYIPLLPKHL